MSFLRPQWGEGNICFCKNTKKKLEGLVSFVVFSCCKKTKNRKTEKVNFKMEI